ncbi:MAG: hypothetical protein MUE93_07620 [Ignavibacteriaceae bacterium]|jgi:hypothetical protein|nr:hypothetical protein [Ignavibacteriaceae bacterium]
MLDEYYDRWMYECMIACSHAKHANALNFLIDMKFSLIPDKTMLRDFPL